MRRIDSANDLSRIRIDTGLVVTNFSFASDREDISLLAVQDPSLPYNLPGGCEVSFPNLLGDGDILIDIYNSQKPRLTQSKGKYNLFGPLHNPNLFKQLPYIAYTLGEKERSNKHRAVTMHAAAVGLDAENAILILGDKGAGKTALALTFAIDHGFTLVGNDLVLVGSTSDSLRIMGGSRMLNMRFKVAESLLKNKIQDVASDIHPYEDKLYIKPEEIGLKVKSQIDSVKAIVRVNIHPGNERTHLEDEPRRMIETLRLYENLSRYIKGIPTPILMRGTDHFGYIPSQENRDTQEVRDELITRMLSLPFYYLTTNDSRKGAERLIAVIK